MFALRAISPGLGASSTASRCDQPSSSMICPRQQLTAAPDLAVVLGADHGLRAPDATHLATAVMAGADRFVANNRKDFPTSIAEISVVHPSDWP